jgi:hypothetical protein
MAGFEPATPASFKPGTIQTSVGFDVIALLPAAAADKLRALRQKARDLHAVIPEFEDRHEAASARGDAERRLQRMLAPRSEGGFNLDPETDSSVIEQKKLVQKLTDDAQRLSALDQERSEQWRSASRLVSSIEQWLRDGRPGNTALQDFDGPAPKLVRGETIADGIERFRRRARELKADHHRIQSAPYPSSHAKAQMRAQIEALAAQGAPNVSNLIEFDRPIAFATQRLTSSILNAQPGAVGFAELEAAVPLLVWLHKSALIAALDRENDAEADDNVSLSNEARQQAEAEMMGDLLAVERAEAGLVWSAMAQNLPVEFRADSNPLAILGCRLETAPRANPSPGTSPEHAFDIIMPGQPR